MDALVLAERAASTEGLQVFPILGDLMSPTLNRGDFALVAPVSRWEGDGCYVIGPAFDPGLYRCRRKGDRVITRGDNPLYPEAEMSMADFNSEVLAIAVMKMNVMDRDRLPDSLRI